MKLMVEIGSLCLCIEESHFCSE